MCAFESQKCNIHLTPVIFSLVLQIIENLCYVMVTVVDDNIMVSLFKNCISIYDCLIPLIVRILIMIKDQIFEGRSKCKFSMMHGSSSDKVINGTIWFADSCMSDTRKTACYTRQWSPNQTKRIPMIMWIDFHLYSELVLGLHSF